MILQKQVGNQQQRHDMAESFDTLAVKVSEKTQSKKGNFNRTSEYQR